MLITRVIPFITRSVTSRSTAFRKRVPRAPDFFIQSFVLFVYIGVCCSKKDITLSKVPYLFSVETHGERVSSFDLEPNRPKTVPVVHLAVSSVYLIVHIVDVRSRSHRSRHVSQIT